MLNSYRWVALSNTTIGVLIVTINMSILLIALPDIFRGIGIDPLAPGNIGFLLWLIMGYLVVTAVLVVSFGRLGDLFGRTRMYNLGFAVFTVFSILLAVDLDAGPGGGAVADRHAGAARRRRRVAARQLDGDPHRRLPGRAAGSGAGYQPGRGHRAARSSGSSSAASSRR